jgi:D-lactate dehydrogenase (cytochrome)
LNSSSPGDRRENKAHDPSSGSSKGSSSSWVTGQTILLSTLAAGIGYGLAASQSTQTRETGIPQYGTAKDFEKVSAHFSSAGTCSRIWLTTVFPSQAIAELRAKLGEEAIVTDEDDLLRHGFSEWSSLNADRLPVAIAYPSTTEEVSEIAKICYAYKMPIVPYSGGSSLEANFSAPYGGLTIDFANMNQIIQLHEADMDVVVQPSIQWMELNEKIKDSGLFFPVDPGPSAMIGGMVGTNCSGTNAVRYGTMKDWVINLTVVLADGRVIQTRRRPRKTSAGYNLTGLFVGSEGTLGIVTEATLKLAPIPEETRVGVVAFPTIRDAASTAMQLIRKGIPVQCMEILDDVQMDVINQAGGTGRIWKTLPTLFFKFSGTKAGVADSISLTKNLSKSNNAESFEFARSEREAHDLWSARKQSLWSMMALRKEGSEVWSTDVAVPISRLPDIIGMPAPLGFVILLANRATEISKTELDDLGLFASILGHIGDGNFHASIMYDPKNPEEKARVEKVVYDMVDRALDMEGSCTVGHRLPLV